MKLLSFAIDGRRSFGVVTEAGVIDLGGRLDPGIRSLRGALAADAVPRIPELAQRAKPDFALDQLRLLPPIPAPEKIICVGVNYAHRNSEYKDGSEQPKYPSVFPRFPGSFTGHRGELIRPLESTQLDYEGENAIVIGTGGRRSPVEEA